MPLLSKQEGHSERYRGLELAGSHFRWPRHLFGGKVKAHESSKLPGKVLYQLRMPARQLSEHALLFRFL